MKRRKNKSRTKISFAATILVLTVAALVAYSFSFRVPSYSIPSDLPPYLGLASEYAPKGTLQVTYDNFTGIRAVNVSAVASNDAIRLVDPHVTVRTDSVQQRVLVTILNKSLNVNNSATVSVLTQEAFSGVTTGFAESSRVPTQDLGFQLYNVTDDSNGRSKNEWLTLDPANSAVLYAEGKSDARQTLELMLSVREAIVPSLFSDVNVTRSLYAAGGVHHLAFAVQNFPVEVLTSQMGVVAVDVVGARVQVTHVIRFSSADVASSQVSKVQSVYKFASDFSLYEECVRADENLALSSLQGAVGLAGE